MSTPLPPRPDPDPAVLARAQARLLDALSRLDEGPTEGDAAPESSPPRVAWIGPQGAWEAARGDDEPGRERYRLGPIFARGGLGSVRRAEDRKLGRTVAIKELLRFDDKAIHRFVREAAITARLQHPGVVALYDLGRDAEGRPFLCMKLVEGESLEQRITGTPDLSARLALLPQVIAAADAVAYAHAHGVIHRDLKPANLLIGELGEAVVIDWGLAKDLTQKTDDLAADEEGGALGSDLTAAGTLLGTLRYMPPEQARGDAVDPRSDVYALGAALYHLIAGAAPFADHRPAQLVHAVVHARPRPLASLVPEVPPALAAIVDKAMARDPGRRYPTMIALAADLRRFQAGLLVGAHTYSATEVARLWIGRHRGVSAVAAAALLAIGALGALAFVRVREARDAEHGQRVVAEARAREAEAAHGIAARRADELVLAQARLTLEVDPSAAFGLLTQLSADPTHERAAQALATAAHALGFTGASMTAPPRAYTQAARLADGSWLASDLDELWRWAPDEAAGARLRHGGWLFATPRGDAWGIAERRSTAGFEIHRIGDAAPRRLELPLARPDGYEWILLPGGETMIGASTQGDPTLTVDVATGRVDPLPGPDAPAAVADLSLTPSADGRRLAGVRDGRTLVIWDRSRGAVEQVNLPGRSQGLHGRFSPDGELHVRALLRGPYLPDGPGPRPADAIFVWRADADARVVDAEWGVPARDALVFVARRAGRTEAWAEAPDGRRLWARSVHDERVDEFIGAPRTSRDGRTVLWGFGGREEVVDVATGTLLLDQPKIPPSGGLLAEDGALLVPRAGGLVRVDLSQRPWSTLAPGDPGVEGPGALSPAGRWALRQGPDGLLRVDVGAGEARPLPDRCGPWTPGHRLAIDDFGRALVTDDRGLGCLFGQDRTDILDTPAEVMAAAASAPAGDRLAAIFEFELVEWSGPTLARRRWELPTRGHDLRYAADGSRLAVLGWGGAVTIVDRKGDTELLALSAPFAADMVHASAFAPTGATLAVYRRGALGVTLHDLNRGATRSLAGAEAPEGGAVNLRYSPSGAALVALDGPLLQRWSLDGDDAPLALEVAEGWDFAFLDEDRLVILTRDGGLELVEPRSGTRAPMLRGGATRPRPHLARTGEGLVLLGWTGELLRYTDAVPPPGEALRRWLRAAALE